MTNLTRTQYLMGNPYAAAIKHGGLWRSVDRAGVLWPPAIIKSLGRCSCSCSSGIRPGPLPPMQKAFNSVASRFIRIREFHGKLSSLFKRCCCFPVNYCCADAAVASTLVCFVSSCAGVASGFVFVVVQI